MKKIDKRREREAQWDTAFAKVEAAYKTSGPLVYLTGLSPDLTKWLERQRRAAQNDLLAKAKIARLESIGFSLSPSPDAPPASDAPRPRRTRRRLVRSDKPPKLPKPPSPRLLARQAFVNDTLPVCLERLQAARDALPAPIREHLPLWSYPELEDLQPHFLTLRKLLRARKPVIPPEAIATLQALHFDFKPSHAQIRWDKNVLAYTHVWQAAPEDQRIDGFVLTLADPELRTWAMLQGRRAHKGQLNDARAAFLRHVNAGLTRPRSLKTVIWDRGLDRLEELHRDTGSLSLPEDHPDHRVIEGWKIRARRRYQQGRMSDDRIARLNAIDFGWEDPSEARWDEHYHVLRTIFERYGHPSVPVARGNDGVLRRWINRTRVRYRRSQCSPRQTALLDAIKFGHVLDKVITSSWWPMYKRVLATLKKTTPPPHRLGPDRDLGQALAGWIRVQRRRRRNDLLSAEQIGLLDDIGMNWAPVLLPSERPPKPPKSPRKLKTWEDHFEQLKAFVEKEGWDGIPLGKAPLSIRAFCVKQRMHAKRGILDPEKRALLEAIHFRWDPMSGIRPQWMKHYKSLLKYREKHGTLEVPRYYKPNQALSEWIAQTRQRANKGLLKEEHLKLLREINFRFEPRPNRFKKGWRTAQKAKSETPPPAK